MSKDKTNVLFLLNSLRIGGAEKHVVTLLNKLNKEKFNLSLCYLKKDEDLLAELDSTLLKGVFCCDVKSKVDFNAIKLISKYIDNNSIDIIVSTNNYPMFYSVIAQKISKQTPRLIQVFHTTNLFRLKTKLLMLFYKPFFSLQDMIIYVCKYQRDYWSKRGRKAKVNVVIPNGVDTDYFQDGWNHQQKEELLKEYNIRPTDYIIGLCAALRPEKSHVDLLLAVSQLKSNGLPVKCLLIGDGPERKIIENKIQELNIKSDVFITGFKKDVRPYIAACDVMTLISKSETFSIAALEAMSLGKPMVMSIVGGAREQIEDGYNGYLIDIGDIQALSEALMKMVDRKVSAKLGANARASIIRDYTQIKMVNSFDRVLEELGPHAQ